MSDNRVTTQHNDTIFEIILNRPEKRNAIQYKTLLMLAEAVAEAEKQPGVRLIVLRGEGPSFCAGLDLMAMGGNNEYFGDDWLQKPHQVTRGWQQAVQRIADSPLPSVALLHNYCLGAGLEISLACDFRYAADDTTISLEETRLGIIPDVGGITRLMQLIGMSHAKEMILTGRRIDANTAEKWGLVNRIMPADQLMDAARELAEEISGCAPLAVAAARRVIQGIASEQDGMHLECIEQAALFHTKDVQIGIQAAIERRPPEWQGQ